jgi:hypothetical protein
MIKTNSHVHDPPSCVHIHVGLSKVVAQCIDHDQFYLFVRERTRLDEWKADFRVLVDPLVYRM